MASKKKRPKKRAAAIVKAPPPVVTEASGVYIRVPITTEMAGVVQEHVAGVAELVERGIAFLEAIGGVAERVERDRRRFGKRR